MLRRRSRRLWRPSGRVLDESTSWDLSTDGAGDQVVLRPDAEATSLSVEQAERCTRLVSGHRWRFEPLVIEEVAVAGHDCVRVRGPRGSRPPGRGAPAAETRDREKPWQYPRTIAESNARSSSRTRSRKYRPWSPRSNSPISQAIISIAPDLAAYERLRAGELIHIDVKKLVRIGDGAGHRMTAKRTGHARGIGWESSTSASTTPPAWPTSRCSATSGRQRRSPSSAAPSTSTEPTASRSSA
jgi:hypothetical protein